MKGVSSRNAWNRHSLLRVTQTMNAGQTLGQKIKTPSYKPSFFYLTQEIDKKIFNPEQRIILMWQTFNVCFILVEAVVIPIILAFQGEYSEQLVSIETAACVVFFVDVLIKLNTGIYMQGHLNTSRVSIFSFHLEKFLLIDVYAVIPFAYFSSWWLWFECFLVVKLVKVWNVYLFFETIQLILKSLCVMKGLYYFKIVITVALCIHWLACGWCFIGMYDLTHQYDSWVILEGDWKIGMVYNVCVYFVVTTSSTMGYGDFTPTGIDEVIVTLVILLVGVIIFSFNITSIINLVTESRQELIKYQEKMINLNIYLKKQKIPTFIKYKLRKYLEYTSNHKKSTLQEKTILSLLSDPLKEEIFGYTVAGRLLSRCRIFIHLYDGKIIQKLSKFFNNHVFSPNDTIIEQGEISSQIYFLVYGTVEVFHSQTRTIFKLLKPENYFGEIGFFTKKPRTATIRCVNIVECLTLKREDLDFILTKFPIAASKTNEIETLCHENNFTVLNLKCYLCNGFGHIACYCIHSRVSPDQMNIPQTWLDQQQKSKKVNPKKYIRHNVHRAAKVQKSEKAMKNMYKKKVSSWEEELFQRVNSNAEVNAEEERVEENAYSLGIQRVLTSEECPVSYTEYKPVKYRMSILNSDNLKLVDLVQ